MGGIAIEPGQTHRSAPSKSRTKPPELNYTAVLRIVDITLLATPILAHPGFDSKLCDLTGF